MSMPFTNFKNNPHLDEDKSLTLDFIMSTMNPTDQQELLDALDEAVKTKE